jgi:D-serine deaminase-like pyridoxal phosphate-dependent protein
MLELEKIITPTLLLDERKTRQHILTMVEKAQKPSIRLRPHFKTHQSAAIGEWFREAGVKSITCSSLQMAAYFAAHGWNDILVAFPVNIREIVLINQLAATIHLELLVESTFSVEFLDANLKAPVDIWLKIDSGAGRTGIAAANTTLAANICQMVHKSSSMHLRGILTHAGQTYHSTSPIHAVGSYQASVDLMNQMRDKLAMLGINDLEISVGDTPGCVLVDDFGKVDEIRPGNFVFFDATQAFIGTCTADEVAVAVACPIVAIHPELEKVVVYGGAIHLSSEYFLLGNQKAYGLPALLAADGWGSPIPGGYVHKLSQEHGIVHVHYEVCNSLNPGDLLAIIPAHSCITVSCLKKYLTLEGEILETMYC